MELALSLAARGSIRAIIDRILPLGEIKEAHGLLEQGQIIGKVILDPTLG